MGRFYKGRTKFKIRLKKFKGKKKRKNNNFIGNSDVTEAHTSGNLDNFSKDRDKITADLDVIFGLSNTLNSGGNVEDRFTFILHNASLQIYKKKDKVQLLDFDLNCQLSEKVLNKNKVLNTGVNLTNKCRPDILHQSLMSLLDSPANKLNLFDILIHTSDQKLIQVNPFFRVPRSWMLFSKVFAKFLTSQTGILACETEQNGQPLLKLISPPYMRYLPRNSVNIEISPNSDVQVFIPRLFEQLSMGGKVANFFVNCSDKDSENPFSEFIDHKVSISSYPVTSSVICGKLSNEIEFCNKRKAF